MELVAGLDTQIFVIFLGVVVALGCTLVAFLVDYLKGKNERLREQVIEMTVRQEERARHPQATLESAAVITAITQVGKTLESVIRESMHSQSRSGSAQEQTAQNHPQNQAEENATHPPPAPAKNPAPAEPMAAPEVDTPPVYQTRPFATVPSPVAEVEVPLPAAAAVTPATEILKAEPDWRQASWHAEPVSAPLPEPLPESLPEPVADQSDEPVVTQEPVREALRSLFESPASLAKAAQLEMQRHLDEPIAEPVAEEAPVAEPAGHEGEPVVRIRVLNQAATPVEEQTEEETQELAAEPVAEPVAEVAEVTEVAELVAEQPVEEFAAAEEPLPVTAPVDFLTGELDEVAAPAPHESFDSLMAAVHEENPADAPAPEAPAVPEEPGVLALPSGLNDRATLDFLKRDRSLFTGLIVSIGINDYARLQETSGRPAAEELAKSVQQLVKSLITAPNGSEFFGCRSADDEFVLVFAGESGSAAQRRLNGLSERLWDFQLRSLGNFSVMFSWGATEANGEVFEDAVEAASERMRETRQNRRTVSMDKTRLKKVG